MNLNETNADDYPDVRAKMIDKIVSETIDGMDFTDLVSELRYYMQKGYEDLSDAELQYEYEEFFEEF